VIIVVVSSFSLLSWVNSLSSPKNYGLGDNNTNNGDAIINGLDTYNAVNTYHIDNHNATAVQAWEAKIPNVTASLWEWSADGQNSPCVNNNWLNYTLEDPYMQYLFQH